MYDLGYYVPSGIIEEKLWDSIDTDKTDQLTFTEFYKWWSKQDKFQQLNNNIYYYNIAFENFRKYDKDNNGSLSNSEFIDYFKGVSNQDVSKESIDALISLLDKNNDGKVDFNEFVTWLNWLK
jgi:Ca2+-binding EF-hand superfamily protein